jgi:3-oxoacyl-[acyl-carrier protein] reductase
MDLGIEGKKALVCGASAGLGFATAMTLAAEGADVIINSRDKKRLEAAADRIEKATGRRPGCLVADLSTDKGINTVTQGVRKDTPGGFIDILVSNAGGPPSGRFMHFSHQQWKDAAELLLYSAVRLTKVVIEGMVTRGWGRLIYITSVSVPQPLDDLVLSNAYRSAVTAFCKTVSNTHARSGVTANCVCPGYTATERLQDLAKSRAEQGGLEPEAVMASFAENVPAGRLATPEEVAATVAFLVSEHAGYITGSSIRVDGGLVKFML